MEEPAGAQGRELMDAMEVEAGSSDAPPSLTSFSGGPQVRQALLGDDEEERQEQIQDLIRRVGHIKKLKQAMHFFKEVTTEKCGSQQIKASCALCMKGPIASTGSARLVDHLLQCARCPHEVAQAFKELRSTGEKKRKLEAEAIVKQQEEHQLAALAHEKNQAQLKQQFITVGLKTAAQNAADKAVARFFYANGISFSAADPSQLGYYREMMKAVKEAPASYIPPDPRKLSSSLLEECYEDVWSNVQARDPAEGAMSGKFGCTYVSDGWDSIDHLPLINSAFVSCNNGGIYWRSVDTSGNEKTAEYCASLMIQDIYDFGCTKVVLVITDTCNTMKKCWSILLDEFPWLSILPCQPHCVSLLLQDIGKMPEPAVLVKDEGCVVNWFSHHQLPLAILREKVHSTFGKSKELINQSADSATRH